jgi:hypothetical protein
LFSISRKEKIKALWIFIYKSKIFVSENKLFKNKLKPNNSAVIMWGGGGGVGETSSFKSKNFLKMSFTRKMGEILKISEELPPPKQNFPP